MNKKYSVFVSSTYNDLKDERDVVIRQLMEMDCIPIGMEAFPAADDEQLEFIRSLIKDCDYHLIIIGGRYGSKDSKGISYTEREFEFALEFDIPIIAMLHDNPKSLPLEKTDKDQSELDSFKERIQTGRLTKYWDNKDQLSARVSSAIHHAIKTKPRPGWVRGNNNAPPELLLRIKELEEALEKNENITPEIVKKIETYMRSKTLSFEPDSIYEIAHLWVYFYRFCDGTFRRTKIAIEAKDFFPNSKIICHDDMQLLQLHFKQLGLLELEIVTTENNIRDVYWKSSALGDTLYGVLTKSEIQL